MRIAFDELPWQSAPSGARFKMQRAGAHQLWLFEFTPELVHPHWSETGHVGIVLEGTMEVAFDGREPVTFKEGDGVSIPGGKADRHRPRAVTDRVRVVFVEPAGTEPA